MLSIRNSSKSRQLAFGLDALIVLFAIPIGLILIVLARRTPSNLAFWVLAAAAMLVAGVATSVLMWGLFVYLWGAMIVEIRDLVSSDGAPVPPRGEIITPNKVKPLLEHFIAEHQILRRRNQDLETVATIGRALDEALSSKQMVDAVMDHVSSIYPYKRGFIALSDERAGLLKIISSRGYAVSEIESLQERLSPDEPYAEGVCLPLRGTSGTIGMLYLDAKQPDQDVLHMLYILVDILAASVEKRRLFEAARREVRAQTLLNEAGRVLTSTLDKQEVLTRVMREVTKAMNAAAGSVLLIDEQQGDMFFAAASSPAADLLLGTRMRPDQGIVGWTIQRRESVLVDDAHDDPRFYGQIDRQTGLKTRSVLCVPLISKDRVIGAIEVIDPRSNQFSEDDLRLLESLAPQAAIAIDNASLHESLKDQMDELERTQDQLLQAEKLSAIGQLVAGVAHELNNPLTAIVGYSQLLLETCQDEQICEDLERIEREAQRSARIVQNLLSFARQSKMEKKPIELGDILNKTIDLLAYQLEVDNIKLLRDIAPAPMVVLGDRYQLQQVFLNLISNAHQAMRKAYGAGTLTIRAYPSNLHTAQLQFVDDGPGIPKEIIGRIFDPFFTTKDVGEGTGLGLSICLGIVQEHQGRIWPESQENHGATFTVELPLYEGPIVKQVEQVAQERVPIGQRTILVIDDEVQIIQLLQRILEAEGHVVTAVNSGAQAKEILQHQDFDLVICDLKMPGINGRELYAYLEMTKPEIAKRVIFSTGDIVSDESWSFLQSIKNPFISKPFKPEQILVMVHKMWTS
jgi:signal transduction histidine kinase